MKRKKAICFVLFGSDLGCVCVCVCVRVCAGEGRGATITGRDWRDERLNLYKVVTFLNQNR